jgi:hypothetical protein
MEKFKDCVHENLKTNLEDKNVGTLVEAAVTSDTCTLSHKKNCWSKNQSSGSWKSSDSDKKSGSESPNTFSSQSLLNSGSTCSPRLAVLMNLLVLEVLVLFLVLLIVRKKVT